MSDGIEIEEALKALLVNITPIKDTVITDVDDAVGKIVAEDIYAPFSVPSFPKSAMDGYAVNSTDVAGATMESPVTLKVTGELLAGDYKEVVHARGSAVRIMTGAPVPAGFNAVVRQEDTDCGENIVNIYTEAKEGINICPIGEELKEGELIIKKGEKLNRIGISLLAEIGLRKIKTVRKPQIAVISTGNELMDAGEDLLPGKIYNSILYMLKASIINSGLSVSYQKTIPDDNELIKESIKEALATADFVITTGGVSVGKMDLIPEVLSDLSATTLFKGANIKPGTPTMGSILNGKVILSLSGNPYAALANFDFYFWEAAGKLAQDKSLLPQSLKAVLEDDYEKTDKSRRFIRAYYEDGRVYLPSKIHKSSVIGNLKDLNCYIDIPAGERISKGDTVLVRLMKL